MSVDKGYLNLLAHLRQPKSSLSEETLHSAICHYLIQSSPTPLVESILASPRWQSTPLSLKSTLGLSNSFKSAAYLKWQDLKKSERGFFDVSISSEFTTWTRDILNGSKNGSALLRVSILGGLLSGLALLSSNAKISIRQVEEELVIAFAEIMDLIFLSNSDPWANEFKKEKTNNDDKANISVLLAANYFVNISDSALSALKLQPLASLCLSTIDHAFLSGKYLQKASLLPNGQESSSTPYSELKKDIDTVTQSDEFKHVASVCKLLARIVDLLTNHAYRSKSKKELWDLCSNITTLTGTLCQQVDADWRTSRLAEVDSEEQLDEHLRNISKSIWTILKTQLFATLMLQQSILTCILFLPPPVPPSTSTGTSANTTLTHSASTLARTILQTLCSFSFVLSAFGGVSSGAGGEGGKDSAFLELKRIFYMALDILSSPSPSSPFSSTSTSLGNEVERRCEQVIKELVEWEFDKIILNPSSNSTQTKLEIGHSYIEARKSFILCCMEQLIPLLKDEFIETTILPFCQPHLSDPTNHETYESAHSVMLAIFAAQAEKSQSPGVISNAIEKGVEIETGIGIDATEKGKGVGRTPSTTNLATCLVPGYARLLLENAKEGGLTVSQLRLAYAALIRSTYTTHINPVLNQQRNRSTTTTLRDVLSKVGLGPARIGTTTSNGSLSLTWLCVEQLLQAIHDQRDQQEGRSEGGVERAEGKEGLTPLALHLTLISLLPSLIHTHTHTISLPTLPSFTNTKVNTTNTTSNSNATQLNLLMHYLTTLSDLITTHPSHPERSVLVENVFEEIQERVLSSGGPGGEEEVLRWWFGCCEKWGVGGRPERDERDGSEEGERDGREEGEEDRL